uniref:Uncharacterized protein n=1 Tax=Neobodo designis TaxID=312471 RepID=A0A7S1QZZ7_NEODS|mmetsp:Transcript_5735/g.18009  ORF Transcript_5735/g.18009 Transcript_5735/m.18009 type:complete len:431 (+) Transcript_5735:54-1346(+)
MSRTPWEFLEDAVAYVGGYDPHSERAQQKFAATMVQMGCVGVVGASTTVLLWRLGALQRVLPKAVTDRVQAAADHVAELTEPPRITALDRGAASHMIEVYSKTAANFAVSFVGTAAFFRAPYLPMPIAVGVSAVAGFLVVCLPKSHVNPRSRRALIAAGCLACGYTFGPINWVAYDCTIFAGVSVLASAVGFSTAAMITRGKVSFFCVSQVLSASLAVLGSNAVLGTTLGFAQASKRTQDSTAVANVNSVLMLQLVSNLALAALHSLPTLMRVEARAKAHREFKAKNNIPQDEEIHIAQEDLGPASFGLDDPDKEALVIFGAAAYGLWTWFRYMFTAIVLKATDKKGSVKQDAKRFVRTAGTTIDEVSALREAAESHKRLSQLSDIAASVAFLYFYLRFINYVQASASAGRSFDTGRYYFAKLSPIVLIA